MSFPPARPPFVGEQVEADVRIRALIRERDQVSVESSTRMSDHVGSLQINKTKSFHCYFSVPAAENDYDEFVPLGAVSDRQLDLTKWVMSWA